MLARLKRSLRRVEVFLTGLFRSRSRKPNISLDYMDWDGLRALTGVLDQNTGAFGPLTPAVTTLSTCIEAFDDQARSREEYGTLRTDLNDLLRLLSVCLNGKTNPSEATKRRIANLARGIEKETEPLNRRMEQNEVERDGKEMGDTNEVLQAYRRMRALLGRFMLNESTRMWKIPGEGVPDTHLDRLSHPAAAWYNSTVPDSPRRNGCTPNTRVDVLKELRNWTSYNNHPNLYWLNGSAGTGKTTIAYSLCEHLEGSGKLAASFFCARWSPKCRDANTILPSISHQLSLFSRPFRYAISDMVSKDVDVQTLPIDEQFELLIASPLRKVAYALPVGVTIVIDGLNECEDDDGANQMLSALLARAPELPVKFFVSSRPDPKIVDRMQNERGGGTFLEKSLDEIDPSVIRADIRTYMGTELAAANPSPDNLEHLCEISGALFEYAAVFVRYVMRGYLLGGTERIRRMQRLLSAPTSTVDEGDERMDPSYSAFLEAALEVDAVGGPERAEINRVLRTVICAREPLTVDTLAGLSGISVARLVRYPLQALHLVLEMSNTSGFVTPRHVSLPKYLLDQSRSGRLYCDANEHNVWLANTCFDLIRVPKDPYSNDDSEPSHPRDRRQSDHGKNFLPELLYAYRHWAVHLELVGHSKALAAVEGLKQWLDACTTSEADTFFNTLLQVVFDKISLKSAKSDDLIAVLHTLVCAQGTLTVDALSNLLMLDGDLIRLLTPALLISGTTGHVTVLHDSLSTFMLDQKRSGKFHCDARQHNAWLARRTFEMIKKPSPPFNICNLESSYLSDREVPDLKERVEKAISPGLLYACRYWKAHLILTSPIEDVLDTLQEFLWTRLLLWMEILNLSGRIGEGAKALSGLFHWLQSIECPDTTRELVLDARNFFVTFSFSPISDSTPQIYTSLLPFWPERRPMARYLRRTPGVVKVKHGETNAISIAKFDTVEGLRCFACSPSGEYIVCGYENGIRIYDTYSGQPVGQPLEGHTSSVKSVAYSPDGAYIASGSDDRTIRIWDAHTGQPVGQPLEGHRSFVESVAYSPDGAYITSGSNDDTIRIWDVRTGQPVGQPLVGHTSAVGWVAYSPDGAHIASGSYDYTIRIWDAYTGQPVGRPLNHTGTVYSVAYSPDGAYIASGSGSGDSAIWIWDAHTGKPVGQPLKGHTSSVNSVAYSPDGAYIASGSDDCTIRIWDAHTGQPVGQPLIGHKGSLMSVAFLPDGVYIVSGSRDNTIRIWGAHTGQPVAQPLGGHTSYITSVAYSPDGAYIASGSHDGTVRIWAAHTGQLVGQPLEGHTSSVKSVAYSPDGAYIASSSEQGTIRIWDADTRQLVGQPLKGPTFSVRSVAYSPDGAYIASSTIASTIQVWDTRTGQPGDQLLKGHTGWVNSVAYSPDGAYIASGSEDMTVRIWDAHTGQPVGQPLKGHTSSVKSVAYSPDGAYIASGSGDYTVRIWDARTGQPVGRPLKGSTSRVDSVAYSPDGAYIASGTFGSIHIWDAHTGKPVGQPLEGHTDHVCSVAYSPDGAYIVSGSWDNVIRIWVTTFEDPVELLAANSPRLVQAATDPSYHTRTLPSPTPCSSNAPITTSDLALDLSSKSKVATLPHDLTLNDEGWVVNANQDRLVWVPPHARTTLLRPRNRFIISTKGHFMLDLHDAKFGEDWAQCFDVTCVD